MKALIPAAGLGTRFLPATKSIPKEMLPVGNKPAIQYVVEEGLASGADEVIVINNREKKAIENHFRPDPGMVQFLRERGKDKLAAAVEHASSLNVSYVYQDQPLGLGNAIYCAADKMDGEPFFVMLGDVLVPGNRILPAMKRVSDEHGGASVIAVMEVADEEVSRFGIISGKKISGPDPDQPAHLLGNHVDEVWQIDGMVEKPALEEAPSNLAIFGRYLLSPRVMEILATTKPGAENEIQLTDALAQLLKEEPMYALVVDRTEGFDTGTPETWLATNIALIVPATLTHRGI